MLGNVEWQEWYCGLVDREIAEAAIVRDDEGRVGVVLDATDHERDEVVVFHPDDRTTRLCGTRTLACYRVHGPAPADPRFFERVAGHDVWKERDVLCPAKCGRTVRVDSNAMPFAFHQDGSTIHDTTQGSFDLFDKYTCVCVRPDAKEKAMESVSGVMIIERTLAALVLGLRPRRAAKRVFCPCMATYYIVFDGTQMHAATGSMSTRLVEFTDGDDIVLDLGDGREGKLRTCQPAAVVRVMDLLGKHVALMPALGL